MDTLYETIGILIKPKIRTTYQRHSLNLDPNRRDGRVAGNGAGEGGDGDIHLVREERLRRAIEEEVTRIEQRRKGRRGDARHSGGRKKSPAPRTKRKGGVSLLSD